MSVKIKVVSKEEGSRKDFFTALTEQLMKSGAITEDTLKRGVALTESPDDSVCDTSGKGISTEDYIAICEEQKMIPDGSHIDDEEERKEYVKSLETKDKAKILVKERILTFRGSDETTDRYGDIIRVKGWDLKNYKKNPVFLAFHDSRTFPAGRTVKVWKEMNDKGAPNGKSLMFNVYFPEGNDWSDLMYNQYKDGLMTAVSVGFKGTKVNNPSSQEERDSIGLGPYGYEFLQQELYELSAVPVPGNQNALMVKSADMKELAKRLDIDATIVTDSSSKDVDSGDADEDGSLSVVSKLAKAVEGFSLAVKEFTESVKNMEVSVKVVDNDDLKNVDSEQSAEGDGLSAEEKINETGQGSVYDELMKTINGLSTQTKSTEDK